MNTKMTFAQAEALTDIAKTGYYATAKKSAHANVATIRALKRLGMVEFVGDKYRVTDRGGDHLLCLAVQEVRTTADIERLKQMRRILNR